MSQQLFKVYLQSISHTFKDLPKGNFYWRFHKRDINKILTTPCPVDSPTNEQEIQLYKELRAQIGVREDFVCSQCPHHAKCSKAFQQTDGGNMQTLPLPHLSKFLETISTHQVNIQNDQKSFWLSSIEEILFIYNLHYSNCLINIYKNSISVQEFQIHFIPFQLIFNSTKINSMNSF